MCCYIFYRHFLSFFVGFCRFIVVKAASKRTFPQFDLKTAENRTGITIADGKIFVKWALNRWKTALKRESLFSQPMLPLGEGERKKP
jgi:hypothetical protein